MVSKTFNDKSSILEYQKSENLTDDRCTFKINNSIISDTFSISDHEKVVLHGLDDRCDANTSILVQKWNNKRYIYHFRLIHL